MDENKKIEIYSPGFNALRGVLLQIEGEDTVRNEQGDLETFTIVLSRDNYYKDGRSNTDRGLVRTWFPGRIHSDTIGEVFEYWVARCPEEDAPAEHAYCMHFPNLTPETKKGRLYRRFTPHFIKYKIIQKLKPELAETPSN